MSFEVHRAPPSEIEAAYQIVQEYYEAASVIVRESSSQFEEEYFVSRSGVWLAKTEGDIVGCVALRKLSGRDGCGEIKRLYVRPCLRGQGVADLLLEALENYAREAGYAWLYLDTAADMKAAARFYERKGFQHCERYNENPQAAIFMRKALKNVPSQLAR